MVICSVALLTDGAGGLADEAFSREAVADAARPWGRDAVPCCHSASRRRACWSAGVGMACARPHHAADLRPQAVASPTTSPQTPRSRLPYGHQAPQHGGCCLMRTSGRTPCRTDGGEHGPLRRRRRRTKPLRYLQTARSLLRRGSRSPKNHRSLDFLGTRTSRPLASMATSFQCLTQLVAPAAGAVLPLACPPPTTGLEREADHEE